MKKFLRKLFGWPGVELKVNKNVLIIDAKRPRKLLHKHLSEINYRDRKLVDTIVFGRNIKAINACFAEFKNLHMITFEGATSLRLAHVLLIIARS